MRVFDSFSTFDGFLPWRTRHNFTSIFFFYFFALARQRRIIDGLTIRYRTRVCTRKTKRSGQTKKHCRCTTEWRKMWKTIYHGWCRRPRRSLVVILAYNTFGARTRNSSRYRPTVLPKLSCSVPVARTLVAVETGEKRRESCTHSHCFVVSTVSLHHNIIIGVRKFMP
jgi:hypothetical protein